MASDWFKNAASKTKELTSDACSATKRSAQRTKLWTEIQQHKSKIETLKKEFGPHAFKALKENDHESLEAMFHQYEEKVTELENQIKKKEEERERLQREAEDHEHHKKDKKEKGELHEESSESFRIEPSHSPEPYGGNNAPETAPCASPPPPRPARKDMGTHSVTYQFDASNEGELSVHAGETVTVSEHADGGWCYVTTRDGRQGYVPDTYLTAIV
eukprot:TRINITY_DN6911_c0_g1_i1.p1 TRINITY_DN6911_c0_g1~~TRINITY_DN6911_c0_g1_i1.p1  ORF type:complete len:216 (-),score=72.92 TRINITY_DN6911_c0_g1_i1:130-777(-)